MKKHSLRWTAVSLLFFTLTCLHAQNWWSDAHERQAAPFETQRLIQPDAYRLLEIDLEQVIDLLQQAPLRHTPQAQTSPLEMSFPLPDGSSRTFRLVEAPVMSPTLAAKYPGMRSFAGSCREDGTAYLRFGYTHKGLHAVIFSGKHPTVYIDAYAPGQNRLHQAYYRKDYPGIKDNDFQCLLKGGLNGEKNAAQTGSEELAAGDCLLRSYRLALACTGEYATFHGGNVMDVMAEYNVAMTRVNGVYERDFTVHMELIDNTDELIFLNAGTDPYNNGSGGAMLSQNQATIDDIIGPANYDIGHVFSTGGGGIAGLGVVCRNNKALGVTGLPSPVNDPFYIDYVAHEIGHQFGANHTQNNSCNRNNATAMEPGSATTIMGYAGICPPNVQNNSDDHFHAISIQEITNYIESGSGGNCPATIVTGNTAPQVTTAAQQYILPVSTPFFLTALTTDAEGDSLTWCWEQMDNEIAAMPPTPSNTGGPAFRSRSPINSPTRYFPALPAVINNASPTWEVLPAVGRQMDFRCSVRDNHPAGGCVSATDVSLTFTEAAGPFLVTQPNTEVTWLVGSTQTISWEVAGTDQAPVSCSEVDIYLSLDGGLSYPVLLADNVANDGEHSLIVPEELTQQARIQVVCADNIFFDISNEDFTIELPPVPTFLLAGEPESISLCTEQTQEATYIINTTSIAGFTEEVTFSVNGLPAGADAQFSPNPVVPGDTVSLLLTDLQNATPGAYPLNVEGVTSSVTQSLELNLELDAAVPQPTVLSAPASGSQALGLLPELSWADTDFADRYRLEVATSPAFGNTIVQSEILDQPPFTPGPLQPLTVYYWRVIGLNDCGEAPPSEWFSFQTAGKDCSTVTDENPDLSIPSDDTGTFSTHLSVNEDFSIVDLNLSLEVEHTYVGDLSATLSRNAGDSILLFDRPGVPASNFGCNQNDLLLTFDDDALSSAEDLENTCESDTNYAIQGTYRPVDPLSNFLGQSAEGEWTLTISDAFPADGGSLLRWSLELCREAIPPSPPTLLSLDTLKVPNGQSGPVLSSLLSAEKPGLDPGQITYRLTQLPVHGSLIHPPGMDTLALGDTFSQADLNANSLIYTHDGSMTDTDFFRFDLSDAEGGWIPGQVFPIRILDVGVFAGTVSVSSPISCFGAADGILSVMASGGLPPYAYSLNGVNFQDEPLFDLLPEGTYTVTVRDELGSEITLAPINLNAPDPVTADLTPVNDSLLIQASGGTPPYSFSLNGDDYQEESLFTGLPNGDYTLFILDAKGCTDTAAFSINSILSADISITDVRCANGQDGAIEVENVEGGIPPYTYQLNQDSAQGAPLLDSLLSGLYSLLITDANGSSFLIEDILVDAPDPLTLIPQLTDNNLILQAEGGAPPYQYSIDGGSTFFPQGEFSDLPNGNYGIAVQDANGCLTTDSLSINIIVNVVVEITDPLCFADSTGEISVVNIEGGLAPYTYSLIPGPVNMQPTFTGLPDGDYNLLITDANGSTFTLSGLQLSAPPELLLSPTVVDDSLHLQATGGTPPYEYSIDGGATFQPEPGFPGLPNGDYTLQVRDANGCRSDIQEVTIMVTSTSRIPAGWEVSLSPNPTGGPLLLEGRGATGPQLHWQLIDALGRPLRSGLLPLSGGRYTARLSVEELPAGPYWLRLEAGGQSAVLSVIKMD